MASDRIFGAVVALVALAYIASATQIQTSFMADPVGPKMFPILIGCVALLSSVVVIVRPDPNPDWPVARTVGSLAIAVIVLVGYAYALKPLGYIIPTAFAAAVLSYQIKPQPRHAAISGVCLSVGLYFIFKFALGLGLVALPKGLIG